MDFAVFTAEYVKRFREKYSNTLTSKKKRKKVNQRLKNLHIVQIYRHPQTRKILIAIVLSKRIFGKKANEVFYMVKCNTKKKQCTCNCSYFKKHKICKHILKVSLALLKENNDLKHGNPKN